MTTTYIWLTPESQTALKVLQKKGISKIELDEKSGDYFIKTDIIDPTISLPEISDERILKVTLTDYIYKGLRIEGLYKHGETEIAVDMASQDNGRTVSQIIKISGKTIKGVKEAYSLIRQGKLYPVENWEKKLDELPVPKAIQKKEFFFARLFKYCDIKLTQLAVFTLNNTRSKFSKC